MALPAEFEPEEDQREWYRDRDSGDLGWLVRREGKSMIRLDRPMQEIIKPFRKNKWELEKQSRPMNKFQVTQVAFEADRKLCLVLGLHDKARREWLSLSDNQRIEWEREGPTSPLSRMTLYRAIKKALAPLTKNG